MKSRWLVNILLFTTVVILTLVARYEPGIEEPETQTVTRITIDAVERIRITRPLRDEMVFERDAEGFWWIAHDPNLPAEPFQVNALTRLAEQTVVRSYPASEVDLAQLELDPPRASLTLNDTRVDFGGIEALENLRYLRVDERVNLVPDLYLYLIEAGYTQFIRRQLLPQQARISSLSLPGLELQRNKSGWKLTPDRTIAADDLQQFIDNWQTASAINIRETDSLPEGERITLHLAEQDQPVELIITSREPELVLARPAYGIEYRMGNIAPLLLEPGSTTDTP